MYGEMYNLGIEPGANVLGPLSYRCQEQCISYSDLHE